MSFRGRGRGGYSRGHQAATPSYTVCRNFLQGSCPHSPCRYSHVLQRLSTVRAHSGTLNSFSLVGALVYSGGSDNSVRGWQASQTPKGWVLNKTAEMVLPCRVSSLSFFSEQGVLVAGLGDGGVRVFAADGGVVDLRDGHVREVLAFSLKAGILFSGGWDGLLLGWEGNIAKIKIQANLGGIKCFTESGSLLWMGCVNGIVAIGLLPGGQLGIVSTIPTPSAVMGLKTYLSSLVVVCMNGDVFIIDGSTGNFIIRKNLADISGQKESVYCLEIVKSASGIDYAVLGQREGNLAILQLPDLQPKALCKISNDNPFDVRALLSAGVEGMFLIGGSDGSLALWKLF